MSACNFPDLALLLIPLPPIPGFSFPSISLTISLPVPTFDFPPCPVD